MQLYALDKNHSVISAKNACKHHNYKCLECQSILRLRGGNYRQNHFYHVDKSRNCRQNGKSMEHLQVQIFLQSLLSEENCALEKRYAEINRIADVVWLSENIVFEVQCSPISAEEVRERNEDYKKVGLSVIWILHEKRFNKSRVSAAEFHLQSLPHYFTNMKEDGVGIVYDMFKFFDKGRKVFSTKKFPIDIQVVMVVKEELLTTRKKMIPEILLKKIGTQKKSFKGDLADYCGSSYFEETIFEKVLTLEALKKPKALSFLQMSIFIFKMLIIRPYKILFRMMLEKACL